ncbi:MAG: leucine-rich repeat domain-containing protein [Clostridia bacterium]|nr:leucine-rich repeat domain-containing protein [Clostridia bacterium]
MIPKRICALVLTLCLALPACALAEEMPACQPGDTVDLVFTVTENPHLVIAAALKLEYDHDALEAIPSSTMQNDSPFLSIDPNGIPVGTQVAVSFRVLPDAPGGLYEIRVIATEAGDMEENFWDDLVFSVCTVKIASQADLEKEALERQLAEALKALEDAQRQLDAVEAEKDISSTDLRAEKSAATAVPTGTPPPTTAPSESSYEYTITNNKATITKYIGSGGDVVIPSALHGATVTAIGKKAFYNCRNVKSVEVSDAVLTIGEAAFYNCSNMKSITFSGNVKTIAESTFWGCSSLKSIKIPSGVAIIADYAFYNCDSLATVTIPKTVREIGKYAFSNTRLSTVTIPEGVQKIHYNAFSGCSSLSKITLPKSLTELEWTAFYGCSAQMVVHVPKGSYALSVCKENGWKYVIDQ